MALAKRCYRRYLEIFHGASFAKLTEAGVRAQTPLWASTGNKNLAYSDLLYVALLIGPETIITLPDATLAAFRGHGCAATTLMTGLDEARQHQGVGGAGHRLRRGRRDPADRRRAALRCGVPQEDLLRGV